jgi:hypothetical protein
VFLLGKEKQLISQYDNDTSLTFKVEENFMNNMVNICHDFKTTPSLEFNDRKKLAYYQSLNGD